jgi:hypothetical protein
MKKGRIANISVSTLSLSILNKTPEKGIIIWEIIKLMLREISTGNYCEHFHEKFSERLPRAHISLSVCKFPTKV